MMAFSIAVSNWLASFQVLVYMRQQTTPSSQQLVAVGQSLEPMIQTFKSWVSAVRLPPPPAVDLPQKRKRKPEGEAGAPPRKRCKTSKAKPSEPETPVSPFAAASEPALIPVGLDSVCWGSPEVTDAELLASCTSGPTPAEELSAIDELLKSLGP